MKITVEQAREFIDLLLALDAESEFLDELILELDCAQGEVHSEEAAKATVLIEIT